MDKNGAIPFFEYIFRIGPDFRPDITDRFLVLSYGKHEMFRPVDDRFEESGDLFIVIVLEIFGI
jgi:hypothetical protein